MAGEVASRTHAPERSRAPLDRRVDRRGAAGRDASRSARARARVCRAIARTSNRGSGRAVVRDGDLRGAARLPAAHAVDLQRSRDSCCSASRSRMPPASRSIASSIAGAIASSAPASSCAIGRARDWRRRIAPTENTPHGEERRGEVHDENARGARRRRGARRTLRNGRGRRRVRALVDEARLPCRCSPRRRPCRAARARSDGTRCCRPRRAARRCRRARSATPDSPARRCGSIPRQDLYVVILTNRVHPTRDGEGIQEVRRALHDAIVTALRDGARLA